MIILTSLIPHHRDMSVYNFKKIIHADRQSHSPHSLGQIWHWGIGFKSLSWQVGWEHPLVLPLAFQLIASFPPPAQKPWNHVSNYFSTEVKHSNLSGCLTHYDVLCVGQEGSDLLWSSVWFFSESVWNSNITSGINFIELFHGNSE